MRIAGTQPASRMAVTILNRSNRSRSRRFQRAKKGIEFVQDIANKTQLSRYVRQGLMAPPVALVRLGDGQVQLMRLRVKRFHVGRAHIIWWRVIQQSADRADPGPHFREKRRLRQARR